MTDDRALELAEAALRQHRREMIWPPSRTRIEEIDQALFVIAGFRTYLAVNPSPSPSEAKREAYLGQPTAEHPEGLRRHPTLSADHLVCPCGYWCLNSPCPRCEGGNGLS